MPTQAQIDAVVAHLSAEYDAAADAASKRNYGWWNGDLGPQLVKAIQDAKANGMRSVRASAARHPEEFASVAAGVEQDLRDLSGYSQESTVQAVLAATVEQTAADVKDATNAVASTVFKGVWGAIPGWLAAVAATVVGGVAWFYVRPLLKARRA